MCTRDCLSACLSAGSQSVGPSVRRSAGQLSGWLVSRLSSNKDSSLGVMQIVFTCKTLFRNAQSFTDHFPAILLRMFHRYTMLQDVTVMICWAGWPDGMDPVGNEWQRHLL